MLLVPPNLIMLWLTGLFSVALLGGGLWMLWEWFDNWVRHLPSDPRLLVGGLVLTALALLGQPLVALFLGRAPRPDEEEPRELPPGTAHVVEGPDGARLHVESFGPPDAPVLLLTHGWGLNGAAWFYARRELAERYRLVVWDLPGLGASRGPKHHQLDLAGFAGDLKAVLDSLGAQRVVLCGHSIGGMIILTFCRLYPAALTQQVAGLILTHTTYTNPMNTTWGAAALRPLQNVLVRPLCALTVWLSPLVRVFQLLATLNGTAHLANHFMQFGGAETRGQLSFITRLSLKANPAVVARGMLAMLRYDATDTLPHVRVPTLVIAADADRATVAAASRVMLERIPHARGVTLAPAGHLGLLEQHGDWVRAVDDFMQRVR